MLAAQVGGQAPGATDAQDVVGPAGGQAGVDDGGPPVEGLGPRQVAQVVERAGQGLAGATQRRRVGLAGQERRGPRRHRLGLGPATQGLELGGQALQATGLFRAVLGSRVK